MMRKIVLRVSVVVVIVLAVGVGNFLRLAYFVQPGAMAPFWDVEIAQGETAGRVVERMKEIGVLEHPRQFRLFLKLSGRGSDVQAGTATIYKGESFVSMLDALTRADTREVRITIPEGFTALQIGARVRVALQQITQQEWDAAVLDAEGFLFPDTYRFSQDADAQEVVARMKENFARRVGELDGEVTRDTIILASVIQREVRGAEDMAMVADIFRKRLEIGMALQADSTVNYVTGGTSTSASYADIQVDNPYNTYKYRGFPPGPISNPGLDAIRAALYPTPNDYYYFLTTPTGEVKYARTLAEHNANRKFLR